jgi:hypothetical protein
VSLLEVHRPDGGPDFAFWLPLFARDFVVIKGRSILPHFLRHGPGFVQTEANGSFEKAACTGGITNLSIAAQTSGNDGSLFLRPILFLNAIHCFCFSLWSTNSLLRA